MKESLERLREYTDSAGELPESFYEYVRFHEPEAVADLTRAEKYLNKPFADSAKVHQLLAAVQVKKHLLENRDHNKRVKAPYKVYRELYPEGQITEKHFNEAFQIADAVELTFEEDNVNRKASEAVARWKNFGEPKKIILGFLKDIAAIEKGLSSEIYRHSEALKNGKATKADFKKIMKLLVDPYSAIDGLCALNHGEKSDSPIENKVVYYSATAMLRAGESVLVIDPTTIFIRKWLSDRDLTKYDVTFAISDDDVRAVLEACLESYYKHRKEKVRFVSTTDFGGEIEKKALKHILVFGTRYYDISTLISTLRTNAERTYRVSLLAPDNRFFSGELHRELCNEAVSARVITLFPAEISRATSPQRKALFQFNITPYETKGEAQAVTIKAYSLVNGSPQKLRKKVYTVQMPLEEYVNGRSFREAYREHEMGMLQKTEQKRSKAYEFPFSEEITINFTSSLCSDGRCYTCAYVRNPGRRTDEENGKSLQTVTKKTTRKLTESEVPNWVENIYPYEEARVGGRSLSIRSEIANVYKEIYKEKSITLKTLIYIYPSVERNLNRHEKAQLKKVVESELGEAQVDGLDQGYVKSVLDELYSEDIDGDDRYIALKIVSIAMDTAVKSKHATKNTLADILERERREKRALNAVRSNLVKKVFTRKEMRCIYDFICKKIEKGFYEFIGILIRLLTGLENNVVCALKWRDFNKANDGGCFTEELWQFNVCRKLRKDGKEFLPLENAKENRRIPCVDLLVQALLKERERQLAIVGNEEDLANRQIVQASKGMIETDGVCVYSPDLLRRRGLEAIASVGIDEQIISLPDMRGGIIETDLNSYHGDIFRSNYEHWAKKDGRWKEGEIAFVIGNTPKDVFTDHYEQLDNEISQHILLKKQESIASFLEESVPLLVRDELQWDTLEGINSKTVEYDVPVNKTGRTQTSVEFITSAGEEETRIIIENEYGFDIIISEVE